ncbi:flagellar basal body rod modification protein [Campylobacter suis]|uniref:Basal-body rod modification protein FlgD n=1 Tax=Campylobacter suis TaxID=2790657 RepID=A0ABN7KB56_9BACT|nr:flagellar basal body rod modification protein [Campylobacter suis]CAD7288130.1 hypothetical protein LMG8286_01152 [Campylobacter suis]
MSTSISDISGQFTSEKLKAKKDAEKLAKADGTNPSAQLDKDAFMTLLLTELKYQDPTAPMDTEKMLTQTSQLATLEMQENTNSTMKELVSQLKSNSSMYALSSLGKMATLGSDSISVKEGETNIKVPIYIPNDLKSGVVEIMDNSASGNVIKSIKVEDLRAGTNTFDWNISKNDGTTAAPGSYRARIRYTDTEGRAQSANYGTYPVESVKFVDGKAQVKIAGEYISTDAIAEYYNAPSIESKASSSTPNQPQPAPSTTPSPATLASDAENALADAAEAAYNSLLNRG